jgi:hypothetical protein
VVVLCLSTGLSEERELELDLERAGTNIDKKVLVVLLPSHVLVCMDLKGSQCPR